MDSPISLQLSSSDEESGAMEEAKRMHKSMMGLLRGEGVGPNLAAELAQMLRDSAAELEAMVAPSGSSASSAATTLEGGLDEVDTKIQQLRAALGPLGGAELALSPPGPSPPASSPALLLGARVVEEGVTPHTRRPVLRSLSSMGMGSGHFLDLRATTSKPALHDISDMDPALYSGRLSPGDDQTPTPRMIRRQNVEIQLGGTLQAGAPPAASPSTPAAQLELQLEEGTDERIEELEEENAELRARLDAAQSRESTPDGSARLSLAPASDRSSVTLTPRRMSPRPPPVAVADAAGSITPHRRGSTVGLMDVKREAKPKGKKRRQRRMSLMSTLSSQSSQKVAKVEEMVSLLTSISSARDASQLVSILLHGVITLGEPDCSSSHLWISALDTTFSANDGGEMEEQTGLYSRFMRKLVDEPEKIKLNVGHASFNVLSATTSKDVPESPRETDDFALSVLAIAIFDSNKFLIGVLEVRNSALLASARDFSEQEEELLMPIAAQAGVTLAHLLYMDTVQQLQDTDFSTESLDVLTAQILESGKELFQGRATFLAMKESGETESLAGRFHDGRQVEVSPSGASATVFASQMASFVESVRTHPDKEALEAEFCVNDYCDERAAVALMLHPVIAAGRSVGVFGVLHTRPIDASEEEQRMLSFVGQIGILVNNCQMFRAARVEQDKIQSRIALLEQLKSIGSELDSSDKMVHQIIERTREVLNCDKGRLFMKDPKRNVLWSTDGGIASETSLSDGQGSIQGWVARNDQIVRIVDAYADPRFSSAEDVRTQYHTHSVIAVPMHNSQQELTGVIMMVNKKSAEKFTDDDCELLKTIAAQAGVQLTNAQMYDVARKDQENFNVLLRLSKELSSNMELGALIKNITSSARQLLDCERGSLFLVSDDRRQLYTVLAEGVSDLGREIRIRIDKGIAGAAATQNAVINIKDAYSDRRFDRQSDMKSGYRTKSILAVPICKADGEVMGVAQMLNKNGREGAFDTADENLLKAFGSQAAVALENSKLFNNAVETRNFLHSVLRSVKNLVLAFNEKGLLTACNHSIERVFGVTEGAVSRAKYTTWLDEWPVLVQDIATCMAEEQEIEGLPLEIVGSDGSTFTLSYHVSPLTYAGRVSPRDGLRSRRRATADHKLQPEPEPEPEPRLSGAAVRGCVVVFEDLTQEKMMKATLSRYLNPALVSEVLSSEAALGGVRQRTTVLFSDIRSFTSISESMDATDLVSMLNDYFEWEIPPIFDNHGVLDKFIGDAIMAVFGVPFASKDGGATDARRACRAALQMVTQLRKFNFRRQQRGMATFEVGLGLNTGKVISGNIGSEKRMEYTVIGDPVNLASRLEGITKTYGVQIVISEYTHKLVHEFFDTRELDSVAVKGKAQGIRIFELLREKEHSSSDDIHARLEEHLVMRMARQAGASSAAGYTDRPQLDALSRPRADTRDTVDWAAEGLDLEDRRPIYDFVDQFEAALKLYREEKFEAALEQFAAVHEGTGGDPPSEVFIARCKEYIATPPSFPELGMQWDGVYHPTSK